MKRLCALLILAIVISCEYCNAQNRIREKGNIILQEYLSGIQSNIDVTPLVVSMKDLYGNSKAKDKQELKDIIVEKISELLSENQNSSVRSLINVYIMIAEENDRQLPKLYFILGNMYVEKNDTINLKNVISSLERCTNNNQESKEFLNTLHEHLTRIRNYVPVTFGITGSWITDAVENSSKYFFNYPKYTIEAIEKDDKIQYQISGGAVSHFNIKHIFAESLFFGEHAFSQIEKEYGEDSLYLFWSSEKLSNTDLQDIAVRRTMTGAIGTGVAAGVSNGSSDFSSRLAGQFAGMAVEIGLNAVFDKLFEPTKRIVIIEAWLKKVNKNMFEGVFSWKESKLNGSSNLKFDETLDKVTLMRRSEESNIMFLFSKCMPEANGIAVLKSESKNTGKPYYKDLQKNLNTEYGQIYLRYKKAKNKNDFLRKYNLEQIEKLRMWCVENSE